jgi:FAD/FMN-containing dehydrogenase
MVSSQMTAAGGIALGADAIQALEPRLRGEVLRPTDDRYDAARAIWNGMIDRHPALIVRCAGAADVVAGVAFAREHDLLLSVRGGGHNVAGNAVADRGLMLDLSPMKGIRVDPTRRTARAEPGLTWGEFDRETHAFGLATTGGVVSTTGIAGLTLGGGIGWLLRKHGMVVDNLLSADVVTADGRLLTASADEHADLFWAIRGGGGNFGVVTSFEYRLHPLTTVVGGMLIHPRERAGDMLRFYRDFVPTMPDELALYAGVLTAPDGTPVSALVPCYSGPAEGAEAALRPLRAFGPPVADLVQPMPYPAMQSLLDAAVPAGLHYYWKSSYLTELTDPAIEILVEHSNRAASPQSFVLLEYYGGAASRVGERETAFPHRAPMFGLVINAAWPGPADTDANIGWARATWAAVQPFVSDRVYSNVLMADDADRLRTAYGANYERLAEVKKKYDPANLLRLNQNIGPAV